MDDDDAQNDKNGLVAQLGTLEVEDNGEKLRNGLLQHCRRLLDELEEFQRYLVKQKKDSGVELRHFKNKVKTECTSLEKLSKINQSDQRTFHTLRSSNLPFFAAVWDTAKCCAGVIALEKRFYWTAGKNPSRKDESDAGVEAQLRRCNVLVDIVASDGAEWIKVSTLTEKRLLFEMAKAGWLGESSSDDSGAELEVDDEPNGLMKQAEALVKASRSTRVRYRHPSIRIVLPKIKRSGAKEVGDLIAHVEALGIQVQTSEDLQTVPQFPQMLHQMAVDPFAGFSETINVDCTILLALVSDLSHGQVEAEDWHHRAILRQIEMEKEDQLLPNSLFPAMGSRSLVCTQVAAKRMDEIVDLIGTKSEKKRRDCLVESPGNAHWSKKQRIEVLQELSAYDLPSEWNLPIVVVDPDVQELASELSPFASEVSKLLSPINQSVFLYGWATAKTTISSNRTIAKEIESAVESHRSQEHDVGPDIWLCPTARSLVGKEKTRRNWAK